ncbi:MAG: hypothetical protein ACREEM_30520 [Blastocatellia bacterium]
MGDRRILTHFTNAAGLEGITGLTPESLIVGQAVTINYGHFGVGTNEYLAEAPGRIFVTELGPEASSRQLAWIGVYESDGKQQFAISVTAETLFENGIRVLPEDPVKSIFSIPANSTVSGEITAIRRF